MFRRTFLQSMAAIAAAGPSALEAAGSSAPQSHAGLVLDCTLDSDELMAQIEECVRLTKAIGEDRLPKCIADFPLGVAKGREKVFRINSRPAIRAGELRFTLQGTERFAEILSTLRATAKDLGVAVE